MSSKNISIKKEMAYFDQYYNSDLSASYKRNRETIFTLVSKFSEIQNKTCLNSIDLEVIEIGLSHTWQVVYYYCAGKYASIFASDYSELIRLIENLSKSKKYLVRRNMIALCDLLEQANLKELIIHNGLMDRSRDCRRLAVEKIFELPKEKANNEITDRLNKETDKKLLARLTEVHTIINKGFFVQDMKNYVIIKYKKHSMGMDISEFQKLTDKEIMSKE